MIHAHKHTAQSGKDAVHRLSALVDRWNTVCLKYHWTNSDYANIVIAFRAAYVLGQATFGRLLDRIGTRRGLTLTVLWYSIVSIVTSAAQGLTSFLSFRFLLGLGESANWPAATKAVSEWFPKKERALAT